VTPRETKVLAGAGESALGLLIHILGTAWQREQPTVPPPRTLRYTGSCIPAEWLLQGSERVIPPPVSGVGRREDP